jgi:hypothetical protein
MFHERLARDCYAYSPERRVNLSLVPAADSRNMWVKFKFKFVLTTLNYCVFCLFRFCKIVFNFKFKLILRKKKIYVNCFFLNFQSPMILSSQFSQFSRFCRLSQLGSSF